MRRALICGLMWGICHAAMARADDSNTDIARLTMGSPVFLTAPGRWS